MTTDISNGITSAIYSPGMNDSNDLMPRQSPPSSITRQVESSDPLTAARIAGFTVSNWSGMDQSIREAVNNALRDEGICSEDGDCAVVLAVTSPTGNVTLYLKDGRGIAINFDSKGDPHVEWCME